MVKRDMGLVNQCPVFIAGSPRSGTTMLAGLLKLHGFWVGESRVTSSPSSNSLIATENIPLKKAMKAQLNLLKYKNRGVPFPTPEKMRDLYYTGIWDVAKRVLPDKGRWLLKTSGLLLFYEFWSEKFPEALWVFPKRDSEKIVQSIKNHPRMRYGETNHLHEFVEQVIERQRVVEKHVENSMYVDVKRVANLDMGYIARYFEFCHVEMDKEIVNDFINSGMMH